MNCLIIALLVFLIASFVTAGTHAAKQQKAENERRIANLKMMIEAKREEARFDAIMKGRMYEAMGHNVKWDEDGMPSLVLDTRAEGLN